MRRQAGWRRGVALVGAVLGATWLAACAPTFDEAGHDRCVTDDDCLSGRVCAMTYCVDPAATATGGDVDVSDASDGETDTTTGTGEDTGGALDTTSSTTMPPDMTQPSDVPIGPDADGDGVERDGLGGIGSSINHTWQTNVKNSPGSLGRRICSRGG